MSRFADYSLYYDLLYRDKDYAGEAGYVARHIQRHRPGARTILNLGCGTGKHDVELALLGYEVSGVDLSAEMLSVANVCRSSGNSDAAFRHPEFFQGDIRSIRLGTTFDVVVSLFHVMSYMTSNQDLLAAIATAKAHLKPGGLFVFDCWYGPAVLTDLPGVRIKRFEDDQLKIIRIAEPDLHSNDNIVDVHYQILIIEKATGVATELREVHRMRYLFTPEMTNCLAAQSIKILRVEEWLSGNEPGSSTWNACFVAELEL